MLENEMVFESLAPIEVPVTIEGKPYILTEASEGAACQWRAASTKGMRMTQEKTIILGEGTIDSEPLLVSLCLYELPNSLDKTIRRPVHLSVVRGWLARVVKALHSKIVEISDLSEKSNKETLLEQRDRLNKAIEELDSKNGPTSRPIATIFNSADN